VFVYRKVKLELTNRVSEWAGKIDSLRGGEVRIILQISDPRLQLKFWVERSNNKESYYSSELHLSMNGPFPRDLVMCSSKFPAIFRDNVAYDKKHSSSALGGPAWTSGEFVQYQRKKITQPGDLSINLTGYVRRPGQPYQRQTLKQCLTDVAVFIAQAVSGLWFMDPSRTEKDIDVFLLEKVLTQL
jgi:hypothetical protein